MKRCFDALSKDEMLDAEDFSLEPGTKKWKLDLEFALVRAAAEGDADEVCKFINIFDVHPDCRGEDSHTPLMAATTYQKNDYLEVISILLKAGANPLLKNSLGGYPLYFARYNQDDAACKLLVTLQDELFEAIRKNDVAKIKELVESGRVDFDYQNEKGLTALEVATKLRSKKRDEIIQLITKAAAKHESSDVEEKKSELLQEKDSIEETSRGDQVEPIAEVVRPFIFHQVTFVPAYTQTVIGQEFPKSSPDLNDEEEEIEQFFQMGV